MARSRALILLLVQAAAFWPVWRWVAARIADGSGDGAALAACAAALWIRPPARDAAVSRRGEPPFPYALATALTLVYALVAAVGPPLLAAAAAFCALLVSWSAWRWRSLPHSASVGLVLLALPALPTAQFLLGFPLRVAAGEIAARLLAFGGLAVERQGTALRFGERLVAIDAPCSGVHMLWTALLLALCLAALGGLDRVRTAGLAVAAVAIAIGANALRTAALFFPESGLLVLPRGSHTGIGVVTFVLAAGSLVLLSRRMRPAAVPSAAPSAGR
jgi:exosortase/archaeosortase family protein